MNKELFEKLKRDKTRRAEFEKRYQRMQYEDYLERKERQQMKIEAIKNLERLNFFWGENQNG